MKFGWILGILCAVLVYAGAALIDVLFFPRHDDEEKVTQVELVSDEPVPEKEKEKPKDEPAVKKTEELKTEDEKPPDAAELLRDLEPTAMNDAPALEEASLASIEQALNGQGGAGDFGDALSFASGGMIGGKGKAGALDEALEKSFQLDDMDQKPRVVFQAAPFFPAELRGKKIEGVVSVIFVVDATGKVTNPRVESSTHPAFNKPALDAVKQWKFEPGVKGGQRAACKMRVPIRFQPS